MENKLLQPLLKAGLLDIGDSDERLDNIEKSIIDLENLLKEDLTLIPAYTLVAIDPNVRPEEPVLSQVEEIIAHHWKALRAKFSEIPVQIIRVVIINSLYNIGTESAQIARIIYLTAINLYPFVKLKKEKNVIEQMIRELGDIAEKNATAQWALGTTKPQLEIPTLVLKGLSLEEVLVDKKSLEQGLLTAVQNAPSGHGTNHGGNSAWGNHFAKKGSDSIADAMQEAINQLEGSISTSSISEPLNKYFKEFQKSLDQALAKSFGSIQAVERRSKLLWWKETLYSSSLKNSYRTVNDIQQAIIMSIDLYNQLPYIVPASVDFLLRDTLLYVNPKAGKKMKLSDHLAEIVKPQNKEMLKEYFDNFDVQQERISITDFINHLIHGEVEPSSLKYYTGIDETSQVSLLDLSVMILHDFMADCLTHKN